MSRSRRLLPLPASRPSDSSLIRLVRHTRARGGRPTLIHLGKREKLRLRALRLDLENGS